MLRQIKYNTIKNNNYKSFHNSTKKFIKPTNFIKNKDLIPTDKIDKDVQKPFKPKLEIQNPLSKYKPETVEWIKERKAEIAEFHRKEEEEKIIDSMEATYLNRIMFLWLVLWYYTTKVEDFYGGHKSLPNLINILNKKNVERIDFYIKQGKIDYIFFTTTGNLLLQNMYYIRPREIVQYEENGETIFKEHIPNYEDTLEFLKNQIQNLVPDQDLSRQHINYQFKNDYPLTKEQKFTSLIDRSSIYVYKYSNRWHLFKEHFMKSEDIYKLFELDDLEGNSDRIHKNVAIMKANYLISVPILVYSLHIIIPYRIREIKRFWHVLLNGTGKD